MNKSGKSASKDTGAKVIIVVFITVILCLGVLFAFRYVQSKNRGSAENRVEIVEIELSCENIYVSIPREQGAEEQDTGDEEGEEAAEKQT